MSETKLFTGEKSISALAFEYIFPGMSFLNAKKGSFLEYGSIFLNFAYNAHFLNSTIFTNGKQNNYLRRIPFEDPSQLMIEYYLWQAKELSKSLRSSFLKGFLSDGEILGGTVEVDTIPIPVIKKSERVTLTGVLGLDHKPKALLAYKISGGSKQRSFKIA